MSSILRAFAPAKLNLGLEVLGLRADGYHEIETLFQALDFGDNLEFESMPEREGLRLQVSGLAVDAGPENLVQRAHELLRRRFPHRARGLRVRLEKRIPLGAGLGGGSSDAAATLMALDRLWDLRLGPGGLAPLALELGSDVPFFLQGGTAIGRGRGERLQALPPLLRGAFLLVNPGLKISSAWAYQQLKIGLTGNRYRISVEQVKAFLSRFPDQGMVIKNRLEDGVVPAHPVLSDVVAALRDTDAVHTAMTGSGATIFGTYSDPSAARRASVQIGNAWQRQVARPRTNGVGLE